MLGQSEINLHWLDNPKLALQDDTIFFGNDVIWRQMTAELSQKNLIIGDTYMKFDGCHDNVKNNGDVISTSKFPQRVKVQQPKVLAP